MYRELYTKLLEWKSNPYRKPLILQGVRQVGKTWLMKEFGRKEYRHTIYINFDRDSWAKSIFVQDYDTARILLMLQAHTGIKAVAGEILIIFDEIQEAEKGLGALKYFCEDAPDQHVIAAGSLLGIAMHSGQSFPVGKVDLLTLHPMTFHEFLLAIGEDAKAEMLCRLEWDILNGLSDVYADLLRLYYYAGGMPEAVLTYIEDHDLSHVRKVQKAILKAYRDDISKHAPANEVPRINMVLDSIPSQLAKENKKFIYGVLKTGARARDFELAIQWLIDAGIIAKVPRVSEAKMPLKFYEDMSAFKLFVCDCGLMGCLADAPAKLILTSNDIFKEYKGAFTEGFVLQQIIATGIPVYYWSDNSSKCEIDFVIQQEDAIIPIEVKAEDNVHAQSLRYFCTAKYPGMKGLRCSMKPYICQDWMINIPLFSVGDYLYSSSQLQEASSHSAVGEGRGGASGGSGRPLK